MDFVGECLLVGWGRIPRGGGNMDRIDSIDIIVSSNSVFVRLYKTLLCGMSFVLNN